MGGSKIDDLISRKALLEAAEHNVEFQEGIVDVYILESILAGMPTIDPVHAANGCYCRECRFADIGGNGVESWRYCKVKYRNIYPTDFCSRGQRREDA